MESTRSTRSNHNGNVPILPKSLQCPVCSGTFTRMAHLQRHLLSHSTEREYKCEMCQADFNRGDVLRRHQKTCDGTPHVPLWKRDYCEACVRSDNGACDLGKPACGACSIQGRRCVYKRRRKRTVDRSQKPVVKPSEMSSKSAPVLAYRSCQDAKSAFQVNHTEAQDKYQRLFDEHLNHQYPLFHPVIRADQRTPATVARAMQACGASCASPDDEYAPCFLLESMAMMREAATTNMATAKTSGNIRLQAAIAVSVVMVQNTLQLHQAKEVREMARLMPEITKRMFRESDLITHLRTWTLPYQINDLDTTWNEWIDYESAKKAYTLAHDIDWVQTALWGSPSLFNEQDMEGIRLTCSKQLWKAPTAREWYAELCAASPSIPLLGIPFLQVMRQIQSTDTSLSLADVPPLSRRHMLGFLLTILKTIFQAVAERTWERDEVVVESAWTTKLFHFYEHLQNWMLMWNVVVRREPIPPDSGLVLSEDALPFYWLAQVSLWAMQSEKAGAFGSSKQRLFIIERWFKRIRVFLRSGLTDTLELWQDLVEILDELKDEREVDYGGLVAFFDNISLIEAPSH
ncbi:hypothetical protein CYLTODRAFT_492310 [Cylindrobasidium torrendii FP15055 ss-10]|uniref:C2H2-type domain-containing protein n=1 Tax=Cylindrobasidium torrendii FP15055 ss-10 TaxID=1314674 RepID=A0A0D7B5K9_9AGAR|nr:hypothetical protein CYLTODRAFT_492310 [Cylindrobasidium torrendii FP15055 ss-10]